MYEDCLCGNPCGLEPMGCATCSGDSGMSKEDYIDLLYDRDMDDPF